MRVFLSFLFLASCSSIVSGQDDSDSELDAGDTDHEDSDSESDSETETTTMDNGTDSEIDTETNSDEDTGTGQCEIGDCAGRVCGLWPDGCDGEIDCGECPGLADMCVDGGCVDDCGERECGSSPTIGADCGECLGVLAVCDADAGTCHECMSDGDCRADGGSPIGLCTSERTCTCWASPSSPRDGCSGDKDCPDGYRCARDWDDGLDAHAACLRPCGEQGFVFGGLVCEVRSPVTEPVWVPTDTTCYARGRYEESCNGLDSDCGLYKEGECDNLSCTYHCEEDFECPQWHRCGDEGICIAE